MPGEWSPDEYRVLLVLRPELEPLGVKYLSRMGGPYIYASDQLMPHAQKRIAEVRRGDGELTGRPLEELRTADVEKAEARLKQRMKVVPRSGRGKGPLTYTAIAAHAKLNRDRVKEIEQLMELGWPLRESHPDFSAKRGYVKLPTPREAARLLRLR